MPLVITKSFLNPIVIPPLWIRTLHGNDPTRFSGQGITSDSTGNIYVAGYTNLGAGGNDVVLAKYDTFGALQWQKLLGGTGNDAGYALSTDSSGNVYLAGSTASPDGVGNDDILIVKYNSSGVVQWQRSIGSPNSDYGYGIKVDSSGNVYVSGPTTSDIMLVKYNTSGTLEWQRQLASASTDDATGVAIDSSGNIYVSGKTYRNGSYDALIAKYNDAGTLQWQRALGSVNNDSGTGIAAYGTDLYLVGATPDGGNSLFVAKYNSSGAIQWQRYLGGTGVENGTGVVADSSGNCYVIGYSNSSGGAGNSDILIAKYDSSGVIQWQRSLGSTNNDYGTAITVDNLGRVCIVGYTLVSALGRGVIAKLPSDGTGTGTYNGWTYTARTMTEAASTLTDAASSLTSSTSSFTALTRVLTPATSTLIDTVIV